MRILNTKLRADNRQQFLCLIATLHSDRRGQILHVFLGEQHRLLDVALFLSAFHIVEQRRQTLLLELFQRGIIEITAVHSLPLPYRDK